MTSGGLGEKSKHGQPTLYEILKEGAKFYSSKNEEKVKKMATNQFKYALKNTFSNAIDLFLIQRLGRL